jgi:hypothetical protein
LNHGNTKTEEEKEYFEIFLLLQQKQRGRHIKLKKLSMFVGEQKNSREEIMLLSEKKVRAAKACNHFFNKL